jgi:predicted MFS family arabinose efflux permease
MVIAAFGAGGILFSLSLPVLVARVTERHMMLIGAVCASIAFILIAIGMPWYKLAAVFLLFGVGFYMLHNCIQVHVTDLSQTARATAMSMHSCFFFFGQAIGPIYYGYAFHHFGNSAPPLLGAAVILVIGLICARFLRHRRKEGGLAEGP